MHEGKKYLDFVYTPMPKVPRTSKVASSIYSNSEGTLKKLPDDVDSVTG